MTELETGLYSIITKYGISALVIAIITIFLVGVLKYFNLFRKIPKENRKPIYLILNYAFVFALSAIYYAIYKLPFVDYAAYSLVVASAVNLLYPLYENLKIRDLFKFLGNFIVKAVAKKEVEKAKTQIVDNTETKEEVVDNTTVDQKDQIVEEKKII